MAGEGRLWVPWVARLAVASAVLFFAMVCIPAGASALGACEATKASIEEVRLSEETVGGFTVEAQINPRGTETTYEIRVTERQVPGGHSSKRFRVVRSAKLAA